MSTTKNMNSTELVSSLRRQGLETRILLGGASYRSGGDIVAAPAGYWDAAGRPSPTTRVRVVQTPQKAFDGTGYDGRGRSYRVWALVPDADGMLPISDSKFGSVSEADRAMIGCEESRSRPDAALFFARPEAAKVASTAVGSGIAELFGAVVITPVVVTRHPALVALLVERGIISAGARVIEHATPEDVRGQKVIGVLPLALAALAASVTEIPLALTADDRGKELSIERLREISGEAVTYRVSIQ